MLNPIANQVNSSNPTTDNADRSASVMVVNSEITRVQQLLRIVEETCPINVRFKEKCPGYDWDGTRKRWEVFFQRKEVQSGLGFVDGKPKNNSVSLTNKVELFTQAVELTSLNIPVFPCTTDKKHYPLLTGFRQKLYDAPLSVSDLLESYKNTRVKGKDGKLRDVAGLAILTGPISPKHDFVAFDFEFPELKEKFISAVEAELPNLADPIKETYWETTAGGGHHFFAFVPSGQGKDTKLARKKTGKLDEKGNEKLKDLIEIKGKVNSYIIIAPSRAESKKSGVKAIGQYNPTNGPLINSNGLRAVTLDLEDFESLKAICRSLDEMPRKPEAKPQSLQKTINQSPFNLSGNPEGDWVVLNQFLQECWGWPKVAEKSGFKIHSNRGPGHWYAFYPNTTDFTEHNVELGPKDSNSKDVCHIFSTGETLSYYQVWKNHGGSMAELYKLAREAGYKMPADNKINDSRWDDIVELKKSDEKNTEAMEIFSFLRPTDPKNLVWRIQQDMIDTCEDFETPIICAVAGLSLAANIFSSFHGISSTKERYVGLLHNIVLADTSAGKDHPIKYSNQFLNSAHEEYHSRKFTNGKITSLEDMQKPLDLVLLNFKDRVMCLGGSVAGLEDRIMEDRFALLIEDEFADYLEGRKQGSEANKEMAMLKKLYSAPVTHNVRNLTKGQDKDKVVVKSIKNPVLNFLAFTQPDRFKEAVLPADFSGGFMGRSGIFIEGRKTFRHEDGRKNFPVRECGEPDPDLIKEVVDRIIELEKHEISLRPSKAYEDYLRQLKDPRWDKICGKENKGIYRAAIDGRGYQTAKRISWVHSLCKQVGYLEATPEDLDYGISVSNASYKTQDWLYNAVVGSTYQKEINAFMGAIKRMQKNTKDLTRSNVLRNWSCAKERNADWVKSTLEPELEKLGRLRVTDKISGTYEVLE